MTPGNPIGPSILESLTQQERTQLEGLDFDSSLFEQLASSLVQGSLQSNTIKGHLSVPPPESLQRLPAPGTAASSTLREAGTQLLQQGKAALVLLNGGMATRFGGRVKGVVDALPGSSFLSLQASRMARLSQGTTPNPPPLLLMNSLATDKTTQAHLEAGKFFGLGAENVFSFVQSAAPRLTPTGEVVRDADGQLSLYGPGHGDLIPAMRRSGALEWLRDRGVEFLLMANVDNLGANLDPVLLGHFAGLHVDMMTEVVDRLPGERGGAPCAVNGRIQIVEDFAFPDDFDSQRIPCFNTNTLWFRTSALDRDFPMRWYAVTKQAEGRSVVQFERLVGQMSWFLKTAWARVDRSRFLPIKTPADLEEKQAALRQLFTS
jgi:UTP--glucose-1-phosphate uridylyltransferase